MRTLVEQLAMYSCYHRDRRNIATHLVGIPLIVIALAILLSRPALDAGGVAITPALLVAIIGFVYYLLLDIAFGFIMGAVFIVCICIGQWFAQQTTGLWLSTGIGLFIIGWAFQFVGHAFEGRKPAFVDDIMGLAIGPLFVMAEVLFYLGLRKPLFREIESEVAKRLPEMPAKQKRDS